MTAGGWRGGWSNVGGRLIGGVGALISTLNRGPIIPKDTSVALHGLVYIRQRTPNNSIIDKLEFSPLDAAAVRSARPLIEGMGGEYLQATAD